MRMKLYFPLCVLMLVTIVACRETPPTVAPTATPTSEVTSVPTDTSTPEPLMEATATPVEAATPVTVDPEAVRTTLTAMLLQSLTVSVPVTSGVGIEGAVAFPLETTDGSVLWLAHTVGIRSFEPEQNHELALYRPVADANADGWAEVARMPFAVSDSPDAPGVSPDYLGEGGVSQIQIEPTHIWLEIEGGVGAHSGVYGILSFDGNMLTQQLDGFSSSPGVGLVEDLNGDGINEVLLDSTDYYVFCYACGVRDVRYSIWYWDGASLVPVEVQPLSASAPEEVRSFNENLLVLMNAGLWQDVAAQLDEAARFSYTEPILQWNVTYARVNAEARQVDTADESAYPLLSQVFYGDYEAAVAIMREIGADRLFTPDTPLIAGTIADGWQAEVADRLTTNASAALAVKPDLAAAYFVRAWGDYVRSFDTTAAILDMQKAAELTPDDELYRASLALLTE